MSSISLVSSPIACRPRRSRGSSCPRRRPGPRPAAGAPARRPGCAAEPGAAEGCRSSRRLLLRRLGRGHGLLEVLQAEPELVGVEPLRAPAEPAALQLPDQEPQLLDLGLRRVTLGQNSIALGLQSDRAILLATTSPSAADDAAADQDRVEDHPAPATWRYSIDRKPRKPGLPLTSRARAAGTGRGWSRCHGKPSSRVASCAALKRTTPSAGDGPAEPPGLQPLAVEAQAGPVVDQDLHPVGALGAEDEHVARERVGPQRLLHQGGQAVHALAEVDRPRRQEDAHPRRDRDQGRLRTTSSTRRSAAASTSARRGRQPGRARSPSGPPSRPGPDHPAPPAPARTREAPAPPAPRPLAPDE
jgi:hypothetical protein